MCKTQVQFWHKRFKSGQEDVKDSVHPGRKRTQRTPEKIQLVKDFIEIDPKLSIRDLADRCEMSTFVVNKILKIDLQMTRKCAKFVPKILTEPQKWTRMTVCDDNIKLLCDSDDPEQFMKSVITGDETWVSTFDPETKLESTSWIAKGEPRPLKGKTTAWKGKTMMTVFFYWKGVIMIEFLKRGDKITSERYCETLANLKECICKKRPDLWKDRSFRLHHDNATVHTSDYTMKKLQKWGIKVLDHPPYLPDLAPCDFALFPKMKSMMHGRQFPSIAAVQKEARSVLANLDSQFYSDAIHEMVGRWQKCSLVNGEYFEGDNIQIDPLFSKNSVSDQDSSSEESDIENPM